MPRTEFQRWDKWHRYVRAELARHGKRLAAIGCGPVQHRLEEQIEAGEVDPITYLDACRYAGEPVKMPLGLPKDPAALRQMQGEHHAWGTK